MSLNDLNVEPNILLILLGSLFVLIGVSGKIFIEKFSVAVAAIGPRILISALGFAMLGIGVIGTNKLFPDKADGAKTEPINIQIPSEPSHLPASFTISVGLGKVDHAEELETMIRIFVDGKKITEIILDSNTPSQSISVEVPKPGRYTYMIDGYSIWNITNGKRIPLHGTGIIDVKQGVTFDIQADSPPITNMQTWNVSLQSE